MSLAKALLIYTRDCVSTARDLQSRLSGRITLESVTAPDSSALSASVLRAGRVIPQYAVCIVVTQVDPGLAPFVKANITSAGVAASLPVVVVTSDAEVGDMESLAAKVLRLVTIGVGPSGLLTGSAAAAPLEGAPLSPPSPSRRKTFPTSGPHPATVQTTSLQAVDNMHRGMPAAAAGAGAGGPLAAAGRAFFGADSSPPTSPSPSPSPSRAGSAPHSPLAAGMRTGVPPSMAFDHRLLADGSGAPAPGSAAAGGTGGSRAGAAGLMYADAATKKLVALLRDALIRQGGAGIAAIGRRFAIVDDDGSKAFAFPEFVKGLRELGVTVPTADLQRLFTYFDHDANGSISYEEFLVGLRGELNESRRALVAQAFAILDTNGDGLVTVDDLLTTFDASKHPDVVSGRAKPEQVLRVFLDGFDGGNQDGVITAHEFERYYATISASVDRDDYFELMMRNCWHISGGDGWAANTSNRRVLVTLRDGSQRVEEVPNDLAAGTSVLRIKKALAARGLDVAAVDLLGSTASSTFPEGGGGADGSAPAPTPPRALSDAAPHRGRGTGTAALARLLVAPFATAGGTTDRSMGTGMGGAGAAPGSPTNTRATRFTTTAALAYPGADPALAAAEPAYGVRSLVGVDVPLRASGLARSGPLRLASGAVAAALAADDGPHALSPSGRSGSRSPRGGGAVACLSPEDRERARYGEGGGERGRAGPYGGGGGGGGGVTASPASRVYGHGAYAAVGGSGGPGAESSAESIALAEAAAAAPAAGRSLSQKPYLGPSGSVDLLGMGPLGRSSIKTGAISPSQAPSGSYESPLNPRGRRLRSPKSASALAEHAATAAGLPTGNWFNATPAGVPLPAPAAGLGTSFAAGRIAGAGVSSADGGYRSGKRQILHSNKAAFVELSHGHDE